jgi:flagellar basal body-associated protein FliL
MKTRRNPANGAAGSVPRPLLILYRALLVLALALGLFLLGGTLFAVFRGGGDAGGRGAGEAASAGAAGTGAGAGEAVFTNIGRLRIPASPGEGKAALVISIAFPYPAGDRAFTEELASKVGDFRRIAVDYFSTRPAEELRGMDEAGMKADLLREYNAILRLGKIETLYFNDLLLFE